MMMVVIMIFGHMVMMVMMKQHQFDLRNKKSTVSLSGSLMINEQSDDATRLVS